MAAPSVEILAEPLRLALAYTPRADRAAMAAFLALDQRISRIVGAASEPMLAQMRLAWWRDMLALAPEKRPSGDGVLDSIGAHWRAREALLIDHIDGWEELLAAGALTPSQIGNYARGRGAPFSAFVGSDDAKCTERVARAARRWALADAAWHCSGEQERAVLVEAGLRSSNAPTRALGGLPRALRGLAVLDALARRALRSGGRPLLEGRGAALIALRAGLLGR